MKNYQVFILIAAMFLCVIVVIWFSSNNSNNSPDSDGIPVQSNSEAIPNDSETTETQTELITEETQTEISTEESETETQEETETPRETDTVENEETDSVTEEETESETEEEEIHFHSYGEWETTRKATCSREGEEIRVCACGEKETRYTDYDYDNHNYKSEKISASCLDPGGVLYTCSGCQDEYFEETTDPLGGHKLQVTGICTRCNGDYSTDMTSLVGAPHGDSKYGFSFGKGLGIEFSWQATNNSGGSIKYCTIQVICYNTVGDAVKKGTFKIPGPFYSGDTISIVDNVAYFDSSAEYVERVEIAYISLEYSDGSMDAGYYGYSTDYYNKKLEFNTAY